MPVILKKDELDQWLFGSDIGTLLSRPGPEVTLEQVS
jgi:putative SOS response-associated peptidase YedK